MKQLHFTPRNASPLHFGDEWSDLYLGDVCMKNAQCRKYFRYHSWLHMLFSAWDNINFYYNLSSNFSYASCRKEIRPLISISYFQNNFLLSLPVVCIFFFLVFVSKAYFVISGSQTGVGVIASHSTDEKIEAVYPQSEEASYSPYQHWTLNFVRCPGPRLFLSNTGSLESL